MTKNCARRGKKEILDQRQEWQPAQSRAAAVVCTPFFLLYLGNSLWLGLFPGHLLRLGMNSALVDTALAVCTWSWKLESGIVTMSLFGVVAAWHMPARRTVMIEYATVETEKATIIGSLDAITGLTEIVGPLIGGVLWAQTGCEFPVQAAGLINAFACVPPMIALRGTLANSPASYASQASPE